MDSGRIDQDLDRARKAWFEVMASYKKTPSYPIARLPHPAPKLGHNQIDGCILLADRESILQRMKPGGVAVEVGVRTGQFSQSILDICKPRKLHLIDLDLATYSLDSKFKNEIKSSLVELHEGDSSSILGEFPREYFDFAYIDGDHSYQGVKRDIEQAKIKVKQGGYLIFNDYTYWSPLECTTYGVIQAVNEFCLAEGWKMTFFALAPYMYCDVALLRG